MRRTFSQLSSKLLKKKEDDELQATLKFLTRGSTPTTSISSFLSGSSARGSLVADSLAKEEDSKHVERILKILNSTLPEVESKKKRVEAHYDILFTQLKNIVEKSIEDSVGSKTSDTICESSDVLYNRLMMLQYTNKLNNVKQLAKIVLAKNFQAFDKVWENISLFNDQQKLTLTILLYYRDGREEVRQEYINKWFQNYHSLHITIQRVLWRCILKKKIGSENKFQNIQDCIGRISNWSSNDTVVLYQSLYASAHLLPKDLPPNGMLLSKNQELFVASLRTLSKYQAVVNGLTKWLVKLVKLSVENKLAIEKKQPVRGAGSPSSSDISIYQYRFIRGLDLELQDIYSLCEGIPKYAPLRDELETILINANDEEQEVKSQMSLKFI